MDGLVARRPRAGRRRRGDPRRRPPSPAVRRGHGRAHRLAFALRCGDRDHAGAAAAGASWCWPPATRCGSRSARGSPAPSAEGEVVFHPQLSAFQLAACRLGWSLADVETLTVHGRPVAADDPLHPARRAAADPDHRRRARRGEIAGFLRERGYGASRMVVLAAMGGPDEARFDGTGRGLVGRGAGVQHAGGRMHRRARGAGAVARARPARRRLRA